MSTQYKHGDKIKVVGAISSSSWYSNKIGRIFTVNYITENGNIIVIQEDEGTRSIWIKDVVPVVGSINNMNSLDDALTITTTYAELAKVYAVMGHVRPGEESNAPTNIWKIAKEIFDPSLDKYQEFFVHRNFTDTEVLNYMNYKSEWLEHIVQEDPIQKEINVLESEIQASTERLESLKAKLKK